MSPTASPQTDAPSLRDPFPLEGVQAPERLSQTLLRHADSCEYAAALYAKHGGGVASHAMMRGSAFHLFAERWLTSLVENDLNVGDPEEAKLLLDEVLREPGLIVPGREQDGLRAMAHNFAELTWVKPSEVVAIEDKFDVELAGRTVTGKIDYASINGALATILDWKTSFNIDSAEEFVGNFQTSLYAVAFAEGRIRGETVGLGAGITQFDVRNVFPRYAWDAEGWMAYRSELIDYAAILDRKLYLERLVERVDKAFTDGKFHAIPGDHCGECPAASECPIPLHLRNWSGELTVRSSEAEARAMATRWWFKKEGKARAQDAGGPKVGEEWKMLKAWVGENGPLRFGKDLVLEMRDVEEERRTSDKEAFKLAVERATTLGEEFVWEEHYRINIYTRLTLRTLTEHELAEEAEANARDAADD